MKLGSIILLIAVTIIFILGCCHNPYQKKLLEATADEIEIEKLLFRDLIDEYIANQSSSNDIETCFVKGTRVMDSEIVAMYTNKTSYIKPSKDINDLNGLVWDNDAKRNGIIVEVGLIELNKTNINNTNVHEGIAYGGITRGCEGALGYKYSVRKIKDKWVIIKRELNVVG